MAGLDTRGLASGFSQGFGLMNQYQQQQIQNKRADRRMDMQEQRFGLQMENAEMEQKRLQQKKTQEDLTFTMGKIANGMEVSDEEIELLRDNPKYWAALDPDTDASISKASKVVDPEQPDDLNDPDALTAINQMFGAEINKGEGGQKRVVGAVPGPDGESVMLELEADGEQGGSRYNAPMTKGRSNDEANDDQVKPIPVGDLIDQTHGMRMMRTAFQSPEAQQNASRVLRVLRGEGDEERWSLEEHPQLGMIQRNTSTGEVKPVSTGAGSPLDRSRGGSGGREYAPSNDVKTIEYFRQQGYSHDEAVNKAMELKGRGDDSYGRGQDQVDYLQDRISELEKTLSSREWQGMSQKQRDDVKRDLKQLRKQRDQVAESLYGNGKPTGQNKGKPSAGGGDAPAKAVEYLRKNDSPEVRQQFRDHYGYLPEGL